MQQKRSEFREMIAGVDVRALVFVDESGIDTHMVRRYARAAPGERARGSVPFGSYKRLTILGGLAPEGLLGVMSIPAATDTPVFLAYLEQVLIPELVEKKPGAIVVLDNLKPHLVPKVREKLHAAGLRLLYLPPYSPDFAPIEQAWSKLKTLLRTAAARTVEALESALAEVLDRITAEDARGWFQHCGYLL